ncbi:MAG: amidohydrolase [Rhodobacteraceae bacterium]|nr:amidohydrolase [Paracoccaceae bacterium]
MITVYSARNIITMDPNQPQATHVAVRDGIILAVGGPDCAEGWGRYQRDDRFSGMTIMPGLIEAHAHVMAGGVWRFCYLGHFERIDPEGVTWPGVTDYGSILERLRSAARKSDGPVIGWGLDPGFVEGPRLDRHMLDQVSEDRPVVVMHSNFHLLTANSAALSGARMQNYDNLEGVRKAADGTLTGELQEFDAMGPVMQFTGIEFSSLADEDAVRAYGRASRNSGVTTVADLNSDLFEDEVRMLLRITSEEDFPVRYAPIMAATYSDPEEAAARAVALRGKSTPKLHLGSAKLFTDGAIQARTAKLLPPGYFTGEDCGIWNMDMDQFRHSVRILHAAGVKTHIHANGDAATEACIQAYEQAMLECPNPDLRHTLEHSQLAGIDQFKRMKALGLTVNLFANHVHYFGDIHWTSTLGPDRARRMDACADAWKIFDGEFAIHSDAPVTPLAPLKTAWCAVNRLTAEGRRLGEAQRISVSQALRCITLGAAHVLKLDHCVGSVSCGKFADFCVLRQDPLKVAPEELADIPIVATITGGRVN